MLLSELWWEGGNELLSELSQTFQVNLTMLHITTPSGNTVNLLLLKQIHQFLNIPEYMQKKQALVT